MTSDSINIALRFALYLDLMLLFGLAAFGLYSLRGREQASGAVLPFASLLATAAVLGMLLSLSAMACMTWAMSGASEWAELWPHFEMMVLETDVGLSWTLRMAALLLAGFAVTLDSRSPTVGLFLAMLGFAALNRFHLGPLLEQARQTGEHRAAVRALRRSMLLELGVAVVILGLVAWLGTLSPGME